MAVTPSGKDKLLRYSDLYLGPYDMTGLAFSVNNLTAMYEPVSMAGWRQDMFYKLCRHEVGIDGLQVIMDDDANQSLDRLKGIPNEYPVAFLFGGGGDPAIGDPCFGIDAVNSNTMAMIQDCKWLLQANFRQTATGYDDLIKMPLGRVLHPATSLSGSLDASSVDFGRTGQNGGWAILLVVASSGGTWTLTIEDSSDDSSWATLITFSADGSAISSEVATVSGQVDQYLRASLTQSSGDVTPVILFFMNP